MEHHLINAFAEQQAENSMKLAIARDLQRIWSEVLQEPLPIDLSRLIYRLEKVTGGKSALVADGSVKRLSRERVRWIRCSP